MAKYIAIILLLLCVGCSKKTHDTVYLHQTDTVYQSKTLVDLIIERDTVNTYQRGDTVYKDVVRWRLRNVAKTDTVYQSHTDTLWRDREVIVEKPVERELTTWQKTRLNTWGWLAAGLALILCAFTWRKRLTNLLDKILRK